MNDEEIENDVDQIENEEIPDSEGDSSAFQDDDLDDDDMSQKAFSSPPDTKTPSSNRTAGILSKSWSIASAHVPIFTGGKITHSYAIKEGLHSKPFLLLPVNGDLAIVDAQRGIKWWTIRTGADNGINGAFGTNEPDEDDSDSLDHDDITSYALDTKNQMIVTCSRNNVLRQYAIHTENDGKSTTKLVRTWGRSGHNLPVTTMSFHTSSIFLATGSVDGTVRIWDVRGRFVTHVFRAISGRDGGGSGRLSITALAWKPVVDHLTIAIGRDDGSIVIHDLRDEENHEDAVVLRDHISAVTSMEWWGNDFFVSTGRDAVLNLWRMIEGTEKHGDMNSRQVTKRAKRKGNSAFELHHLSTKKRVPHYRRVQTLPVYEQIEGMVLLPTKSNQLVIVTAGNKGVLRQWKANVESGNTPQLKLTSEQLQTQAFGQDRGGYLGLVLNGAAIAEQSNNEVLIAIDAENNIYFVDAELALKRTFVGHNDEILDLKIIPRTESILVATNSPQLRVFDLNNFSCSVLNGHTATVLCVNASPCGRYLASCGKDKTLRLWKLDSLECVGIATGHTEPIGACCMSQKIGRYEVAGSAASNGAGAFCITGSMDRTLKRWNLPGLNERIETENGDNGALPLAAAASVRGHEKDINVITVAPNDGIVASGSQDKTVKLWDTSNLSHKATLKGHKRGVWDCQFSPVDRIVASGSGDKTLRLWSLTDFSCVRTFQGHISSVLRIRFLSTGLQLVSSAADGLLKVWTIRTNECEYTMDGHSDKVWALDLAYSGGCESAGGSKKEIVVSGGADSRIVVWKDTTAKMEKEERNKEAESILLEQQMANHLRHQEYDKALEIALEVDKPMKTYKIFALLLEPQPTLKGRYNQDAFSTASIVLKKLVSMWDLDRVAQVLRYCREWNTRAKNAPLAMLILQTILTTIPVEGLTSQAAARTSHGNIPELLAGITPYAERHFDRLDCLHSGSYLLDYLLFNMRSLDQLDLSEEDEPISQWEAKSKLVLSPESVDGRVQAGGQTVVGTKQSRQRHQIRNSDVDALDSGMEELLTIGDSSSSSDIEDFD